jgi:hypothetical protein
LIRFSHARIRFIAFFRSGSALFIGDGDFRVGIIALFFCCAAAFLRGSERLLELRDLRLKRFVRFVVLRSGFRRFLQ